MGLRQQVDGYGTRSITVHLLSQPRIQVRPSTPKKTSLSTFAGVRTMKEILPLERAAEAYEGSVATLELRRSLAIASAKLDRHRAEQTKMKQWSRPPLAAGTLPYAWPLRIIWIAS